MEPFQLAMAMVGGLVLLLVLGLPIAFALLAVGMASIILTQGWSAADYLVGNFPYAASSDFALIIIPMFLFMGEMAYVAGMSGRAFKLARAWVGHLPGGLPIAAVASCAGFSAICGSSIVTAATIGRISIPEMLKAGYSQRLAGGAVAAAGALGVLIPPSGILVIYSIATQVPILQLFACAIVPGILTAVVYAIGIYFWVKIDPREGCDSRQERIGWGERVRSLSYGWEIIVLFGLVMGSMLTGIATPTEASALGAATALAVTLYRRVPFAGIRDGLLRSGTSTSSVFILIIASGLFSLGFATTQAPQMLASFVNGLALNPIAILIILLIPYLFFGMFLDAISMILLTMPLVFPVVVQNDINPILFGILVTKMAEISNITPPVGLNVYVLSKMGDGLSVGELFKGSFFFVIMEIVIIGLFIAFPEIVLFPVMGN